MTDDTRRAELVRALQNAEDDECAASDTHQRALDHCDALWNAFLSKQHERERAERALAEHDANGGWHG